MNLRSGKEACAAAPQTVPQQQQQQPQNQQHQQQPVNYSQIPPLTTPPQHELRFDRVAFQNVTSLEPCPRYSNPSQMNRWLHGLPNDLQDYELRNDATMSRLPSYFPADVRNPLATPAATPLEITPVRPPITPSAALSATLVADPSTDASALPQATSSDPGPIRYRTGYGIMYSGPHGRFSGHPAQHGLTVRRYMSEPAGEPSGAPALPQTQSSSQGQGEDDAGEVR